MGEAGEQWLLCPGVEETPLPPMKQPCQRERNLHLIGTLDPITVDEK